MRWYWVLPGVHSTLSVMDRMTPTPTSIKNGKTNVSTGCYFTNGYSLSIAQLSKEQVYLTTRMKIIKNIKLIPISFIELKELSDPHL